MTPPLPATVRREPGIGGADLLIVETPGSTARIHTYGAHVVSWVPRGAADVLWLSPLADSTPGAAIRGGIPLCFPWFGPHPTGGGAAHGFARVSVWRLVEAASAAASASAPDGDVGAADGGHAADDVALTLELTEQDVDPTLATAWPHPFTARLRVVVGRRLTLSLTVTNTGDHPITVSEALHTYLAVGDVRRAEVRGLEGAVHVDAADGGARRTLPGPVAIEGETDRVYLGTTAPVQVVEPGRPTVSVAKSGSGSTVVWNPGPERAAAMRDVPDDAWTSMLCVETANALDDALRLAPGETHTMTTRISAAGEA